MGLAILRYDGVGQNGSVRLTFDLGSNRYWKYSIGDDETFRRNGLKLLENESYTSPLSGPLPEARMGRGAIEVPASKFDRKNKFIQLFSYRTQRGVGPAISDVVQVPATSGNGGALPVIEFSMEAIPMSNHIEVVPFSVRESRGDGMSHAMFLGFLTNLLPSLGNILPSVGKLLPSLGNLFGGLFGGGKGGGKGGKGGSPFDAFANFLTPENMNLIKDMFQKMSSAKSVTGFSVPAREKLTYAKGYNQGGHYSHAMIAPALLALMPLLQKVMNPETLKVILGNLGPAKLMGATTDSIVKVGGMLDNSVNKVFEHLEKIHPKNDPLDAMIANMSLAKSIEIKYRRTDAVTINFPELSTSDMNGRPRILYKYGQDLSFPLTVQTPRTIKNGGVQIVIKNPKTLEIYDQKKTKVENVSSGPLNIVPTLSWARLSKLTPGEDYLVSVSLSWKTRKGERVGTSKSMLITLVEQYSFDRVEQNNELVPLDDPHAYQDLWHNVWQSNFTKEYKKADVDCKYYYVLDGKRSSTARMETLQRNPEADGLHEKKFQLKSGIDLNPEALNHLLTKISTHPALNHDELAALRTPDFIEHFNQAAKTKLDFRGRDGDSISLWVYPVVKVQRVILQQADAVDQNGHVTGLSEHEVFFPIPAMAQFVGLRSEH